ncbi:site-specific DNA-methyltransferase [Photorhabdus luminescens]|uniref:Site-specific DNA-methyltransferase n=1 Tax=Photorhabdus luminescens subsp. sonorensis TaxID=1173677 RepID=A0A5C4RLZ8_PHOLU|nr:site-specific DNA-methyltransferase [Photorhabdus luminescens subsp. sonorensis]
MNLLSSDEKLLKSVKACSTEDHSYWSFVGRSRRQYCHALIQYPAMMVPAMQGELIDAVMEADSQIKRVLDPFVGSGTTLGEAMCRGLDFSGIDINPLAILACEVKSGPLFVSKLKEKSQVLISRIDEDFCQDIAVSFGGIDKWFIKKIQIELSVIYRAIKSEPSKWARKIFWLSMSNTVRTVCNSRSSTFKLHIKTDEQIESIPSALVVFKKNLIKNIENIKEQKELLKSLGMIKRSKSESKVEIWHADTSGLSKKTSLCDLLVSSPPYGDNHTTVTYGQYSYLPLMWIDRSDIDQLKFNDLLENKSSIDSKSLGGSIKDAKEKYEFIKNKSLSLVETVELISLVNGKNIKKLISFIYDLDKALDNTLSNLRSNAYMIWTLGNRRISNIEIPLDKIMRELLEHKGCKYIYQLDREIHNKRMAKRNRVADTMDKELILIMRK